MPLRQMSRWMTHLDERILEHLDDEEPLTAWQLSYDLGAATERRARERCLVLAHAGFVAVIPRRRLADQYDITGWGQRYLLGEIDANHRRPDPAPRPPEGVRPGWYAGFG